jgi:hypothetical protein
MKAEILLDAYLDDLHHVRDVFDLHGIITVWLGGMRSRPDIA